MTVSPAKTTIPYRVPYADTDQMGIVYYANYFVYFERLRNELLRATGVPYRVWEERGLRLPVVEAHAAYIAPARYDDLLEIPQMAADIEARGVLQNLLVTPVKKPRGTFEVFDGGRRLRGLLLRIPLMTLKTVETAK